MRILAIRGENLASLAQPFALELDRGPLAGAGLFAIVGPVGAGKSTLLDALCLPLFDRTPRLSGHSGGVRIGDDTLAAKEWLGERDPRTLLRREAKAGFAEVDFLGRDGVRYRAHWSVRRARAGSGRLQAQELTLRDLDRGVVVAAGRRTEVLAAIEQRLGLDFSQFCRSVLLAQGEFAAFLRAKPDERAKLLETLTGADVYRRLSQAAHARARAGELEVAKLRAQLDAHAPLAAAVRAAIEANVRALHDERRVCGIAISLADGYVRWHHGAEQHRLGESEAAVTLQRAKDAVEFAAPRQRALERRQRALAVVPRREAAVQAGAVAAAAHAAAARAHAAAAEHERRTARARDTFVAAFRAFAGGVPPEPAPLVIRELPHWEPLLAQWQEAEHAGRLGTDAVVAHEAAVAAAAAGERALQPELARAEAVVRAASAAVAAAQADVDVPAAERLAARRLAVDAAMRQSASLQALAAGWARAAAHAASLATSAAALQRDVVAATAAATAAAAARDAAAAAAQLARERHAALQARHGLAELRARLTDGEPCPLCGASEHPAAHGHDDARELAAAAVARNEHDARAAAAAVAATRADADLRTARRDLEHTLGQARTAATDAAAAARAFSAAASTAARSSSGSTGSREGTGDAGAAVSEADGGTGDAGAGAAGAVVGEGDGGAKAAWAEPAAAIRWCERWATELAAAQAALAADEAHVRDRVLALQRALQAAAVADRNAATFAAQRDAVVERQRTAAAALTGARAAVAEHARRVAEVQAALAAPCAGLPDGVATLARLGSCRLERVRAVHAAHVAFAAAAQAAAATTARVGDAEAAAARAAHDATTAAEALARALAAAEVDVEDVEAAAGLGAAVLHAEAAALRALGDEVTRARAVLAERVERRKQHESLDQPSLDAAEAAQALADARASADAVDQALLAAQGDLHADDLVQKQRTELAPRLHAAERSFGVWATLDELIGSSSGDRFAVFAQEMTLDLLLLEANRRLAELARRYRLRRNPGGALDFVVVDLDLGETTRSVWTLSGGETFLVSLALALALATLAAPRARVETLFLDEGFGTLDAHALEIALGALDSLQALGCQVGVISHVDGIAERIGAQVIVQPDGGGRSRVLAQAR